jgi:hypothetical protein
MEGDAMTAQRRLYTIKRSVGPVRIEHITDEPAQIEALGMQEIFDRHSLLDPDDARFIEREVHAKRWRRPPYMTRTGRPKPPAHDDRLGQNWRGALVALLGDPA